jgi:hypothetical protein
VMMDLRLPFFDGGFATEACLIALAGAYSTI